MQTDLFELQGELLALRCFLAALVTSMPLAVQLRAWPSFERHAELVRDRLGEAAAGGFERAVVSLRSRSVSPSVSDLPPRPSASANPS